MDKLDAMKAFVRVVEAGNFTKAADSLSVPKAQMTRYVQSLEEMLRTRLLNRTTRRVTVTADGAAYYDRVVRLLGDFDELDSIMSRARGTPKGKLRVDVASQLAHRILIPAMADFTARYPEIQIDIGVSDRPVDLIGENVDCVIRAGKISDQSLVARRIGEVRRVVVASPAYLERAGVPQHPSELESPHHRVLGYFPLDRFPFVLQRGEESYELQAKPTLSVNDTGAMLTAALAGLGISRSSCFMISPHVAAGELKVILPGWSAGAAPLYVVYPPNRHVSAKLRVFIDWVAEVFERALSAPIAGTLPKAVRSESVSVLAPELAHMA